MWFGYVVCAQTRKQIRASVRYWVKMISGRVFPVEAEL
jgi:hypothetical protein